jgi:hypothetical protein
MPIYTKYCGARRHYNAALLLSYLAARNSSTMPILFNPGHYALVAATQYQQHKLGYFLITLERN